jgi:DNA-binding transcriptional ArsR family regulator
LGVDRKALMLITAQVIKLDTNHLLFKKCAHSHPMSAFFKRQNGISVLEKSTIDISEYSDIMICMNTLNVLKALSNEKRLKILEWLKEPCKHFTSPHCDVSKDGVCVGLIEKKTGLSQSTVSQYLLQLQQAGLITMERQGQWTYCKLNKKFIKEFIMQLNKIF